MKRRNTPAKQRVLEIMQDAGYALSQDMIEQKMTGKADRVTIYRILNSFCEDGLTHKVVSDDGKSFYALCGTCSGEKHSHNHFHFQCVKCDRVECLKEDITYKVPKGYQPQHVNCLISGYCNKCA
ncbi:MAG: transcriptional repressor [Flavipsychrobacter sp.]|nr:transcriptional repressor [Flavipsychrobacter sp.]